VSDRTAAEDLVQETLLAGLEGINRFTGKSSIRTWLVSILKNKIVDRLRRLHREDPLDPSDLDEQEWRSKFDATNHWIVPPNDWGDPAAVLENNALGRALTRCIEKLPEQLRTLIVLREIDGLESAELIDILNISSHNNLWVMLSRGREKLRMCMENNWFRGERR